MNTPIAWGRAICGVLAGLDETSGDCEDAMLVALMFIALHTVDFPDMKVSGDTLEILRWQLWIEGKI